MKKTLISSSLLLSLIFSASAQDRALLLSQITVKEQQLAKIQKEISDLRNQLANSSFSKASYTVKAGDTIHSIARTHKISPSDLMTWNGITDPTRLGVGETLKINHGVQPANAAPAQKNNPKSSRSYTVEKGDTFYSIARRHNMSLAELKALNPDVSTHLIAPGQSLQVTTTPEASPAPKPAPNPAPKKTPETKEPITHSIATKTTTPKKPVAAPIANNKPVAPPKPKSEPVIEKPAPPLPPVIEKPEPKSAIATLHLKEEMTFEEFAKKHGTTTDKLNDLNGWSLPKGTVLARGSEIQVPQ